MTAGTTPADQDDVTGQLVLRWIGVGGGACVYRVKTRGDYHVDLQRMLYNWRLWCISARMPVWMPGRFWCYAGVGYPSFAAALLGAVRWDVAPGTEPEGWNKNGQTGEWRPSEGAA